MINLALQSIFVHTSRAIFACPKILRQGASVFTSLSKEDMLWILSPLKIHRIGRVLTREPWVQLQAL
jgi:hypothetical protein